MYKGFDENGFIEWLEKRFDVGVYGRVVVSNIIDYAHKHEQVGKDQFAYFLSDILPGIEFIDVVRFCEDEILTDTTISLAKRIVFSVKCYGRDLTIELENRKDREEAKKIIFVAYDIWCEQPEEIGDMCCEEYICNELKVAGIKFEWVGE